MNNTMITREVAEKLLEGREIPDDIIQSRLGNQQQFTKREMADIMSDVAGISMEEDMKKVAGKTAGKQRGWKGKAGGGGAKPLEQAWEEELRIVSSDENIDDATAMDLAADRTERGQRLL